MGWLRWRRRGLDRVRRHNEVDCTQCRHCVNRKAQSLHDLLTNMIYDLCDSLTASQFGDVPNHWLTTPQPLPRPLPPNPPPPHHPSNRPRQTHSQKQRSLQNLRSPASVQLSSLVFTNLSIIHHVNISLDGYDISPEESIKALVRENTMQPNMQVCSS